MRSSRIRRGSTAARGVAAFVGCLWLAAACEPGREAAAPPPANPPAAVADRDPAEGSPAELTEHQRELLEALGYVYFSQDEPSDASGVVVHDRARAHPGVNLHSIRFLCRAELRDMDGALLHAWEQKPCRYWSTAELLPGGDLLVTGMDPTSAADDYDPAAMFLMRLAPDGSVRFKRAITAHHDASLTPSGEILTIALHNRPARRLFPHALVEDERLTLLSGDGEEIVAETSVLDAILRPGSTFPIRKIRPRKIAGELVSQMFHANAIEWIDRPDLAGTHPVYAAGNVLTCLRNQDRIVILSYETGEILWSWGLRKLELPHHPTLLDNGNVLLFDNGTGRKWSRVLEVDPRTDEIVWSYQADPPESFFSANRGSNERLPNGNTLIADSDSGRAFEVTPEGETVWEFFAPQVDAEGRRATIERIKRYDPADLPWLAVPGAATATD